MRSIVPFLVSIVLTSAACGQTTPSVAHDPSQLKHYEIRADRLPKPYATSSAGNPSFTSGRPASARLHLPPGFQIAVFSDGGFREPRSMALAPNGDVFVADGSAGKVIVLRDADHDGVAESRWTFAEHLDRPFGLAFRPGFLYVGNTDAVVRFGYEAGQTSARRAPTRIASLPSGGHWTRNLAFSADGSKLYVSVGSASNVGAGEPPTRAAILEMNPDGTALRVFASGLRNPVGLSLNSVTKRLWTVVNERDGLGDDLPPDYLAEVNDGDFFGWPYAYIGPNEDPRRKGERPDLVKRTRVPDILLQAHSAPLGLAFYRGAMFPKEYDGDAFIALHGSWNRSLLTGYKVVRVKFRNGRPVGGYDDFIVGWSPDATRSRVWGRPVGLLVLADGSLLVSDDGAAKIWRVTH